jgi:hypothetical protein
MNDLTEAVLRYQRTGTGLGELVQRVSCLVYDYPRRRTGFDEDDCGDFLLFIRRRIPSFIHNYRYGGKPFEAYLNGCLRWQLRSFGAHKSARLRQDRLSNAPDRWEEISELSIRVTALTAYGGTAVAEVPAHIRVPRQKRQRRALTGRRLVVLAMKGCLRLQRADIEALARATGYSPEYLAQAWESLRAASERRLARLQQLRARRNRTFFRLLCVQDQLAALQASGGSDRLEEEAQRLRTRLLTIREQISRMSLAPTNHEIAQVCGIPKGSVDSALYYLKTLWSSGRFPALAECELIGTDPAETVGTGEC